MKEGFGKIYALACRNALQRSENVIQQICFVQIIVLSRGMWQRKMLFS